MQYTKISADAFKNLQLNAGILLDTFDPATATITDSAILGATSGGVNFTATPSYVDLGEDVDNAPKNTMELKRLDSYEVKMSGTFVTVSTALAQKLIGAADIDSTDTTKVTPRADLATTDFDDIWWVGDYSDKNTTGDSSTAGYCAIKMSNALSTGGFQIQSSDKAKGTFSFEFTAHYSMSAQDTVPFVVYIKAGT